MNAECRERNRELRRFQCGRGACSRRKEGRHFCRGIFMCHPERSVAESNPQGDAVASGSHRGENKIFASVFSNILLHSRSRLCRGALRVRLRALPSAQDDKKGCAVGSSRQNTSSTASGPPSPTGEGNHADGRAEKRVAFL